MTDPMVDIHVQIPRSLLERLRHFCEHSGRQTFLIKRGIEHVVKEEEDREKKFQEFLEISKGGD